MSEPERPEPPNRRATLAAIVAIVVLAVAGWWISARLHQASSIQDCVMQGRRNCAPVNK
jgi:uncharacterized membrane protein